MITVISGTNRKASESLLFARQFVEYLQNHGEEEVKLLSLESSPHDWFHSEMYDTAEQTPSLRAMQDEYILAADKFLIISPEYNGSFPGVLKLFLDACSIREYATNFKGKKSRLSWNSFWPCGEYSRHRSSNWYYAPYGNPHNAYLFADFPRWRINGGR